MTMLFLYKEPFLTFFTRSLISCKNFQGHLKSLQGDFWCCSMFFKDSVSAMSFTCLVGFDHKKPMKLPIC